jgi:hypothetical protein
MAWTAPRTWVTSELVTSSILNTHVRDNLKELWRVIETVPFSGVAGPGQGHIYGLSNGTPVAALTTRTYPGFPVEIRLACSYIYETVTVDGWFVVGLDDTTGTVGVTTAEIIAQGNAPHQGGGVYSKRFTPSAAAHTYKVSLWSGNGTGADSAAIGPGTLTLLERGG